MRNVVRDCEKRWGLRPVIILACQDGEDEHWQVWHPDIHGKEDGHAHFTIDKDAECFQHIFN